MHNTEKSHVMCYCHTGTKSNHKHTLHGCIWLILNSNSKVYYKYGLMTQLKLEKTTWLAFMLRMFLMAMHVSLHVKYR